MISKHKYTESIYYHKFEAARGLDVVRLKTRGLQQAADEFQRFYSASGKPKKFVVSVHTSTPSYSVIPKKYRSCMRGKLHFFTLCSIVSFWVPYYLRIKWLGAEAPTKYNDINRVFNSLLKQGLIAISSPSGDPTESSCNALVVGDLGFVSRAAISNPTMVFTSSGYSIIDDYECIRPFQSIHDPIGFRCSQGIISSFPAYNRGAIIFTGSEFTVSQMTSKGFSVSIPAIGLEVSSNLTASNANAFIISPEDKLKCLPKYKDTLDLIIVEKTVVGAVIGGVKNCPLAATILRCSASILPINAINDLERNNSVVFQCSELTHVFSGLQCGPVIVKDGRVIDHEDFLVNEFFVSDSQFQTVAPSTLARSARGIRAARMAVGVELGSSTLKVIVIEGTASGVGTESDTVGGNSSVGATFHELSEICLKENLKDAMALDSGGSVCLFHEGMSLIEHGDFRTVGQQRNERQLAHAISFTTT